MSVRANFTDKSYFFLRDDLKHTKNQSGPKWRHLSIFSLKFLAYWCSRPPGYGYVGSKFEWPRNVLLLDNPQFLHFFGPIFRFIRKIWANQFRGVRVLWARSMAEKTGKRAKNDQKTLIFKIFANMKSYLICSYKKWPLLPRLSKHVFLCVPWYDARCWDHSHISWPECLVNVKIPAFLVALNRNQNCRW